MLALRSFRRPLGTKFSSLRLSLRLQHEHHSPHKEYFQHPSQYPINGQPISPAEAAKPALNTPTTTIHPLPQSAKNPSLTNRILRSIILTLSFFAVGFTIGTGVITWEYIQPPFESGSEEERELLEEIQDIIDTHPIIVRLREDGWTEEDGHSNALSSQAGQHIFSPALSGVQGLPIVKHFRPPKGGVFSPHSGEVSMTTFLTGFGIERWPEVVHEGALATILDEAVIHNLNQTPGLKPYFQIDSSFNFMQRIRPGEVYTIFVIPHGVQPLSQYFPPIPSEKRVGPDVTKTTTMAILVSGTSLPQLLPANTNLPMLEGKRRGDINVVMGDNTVHATLAANWMLHLSDCPQQEGESDEDFGIRRQHMMMKIYRRKLGPWEPDDPDNPRNWPSSASTNKR